MVIDVAEVLGRLPEGLFIGGRWVGTERQFDVHDPSDDSVLCAVSNAGVVEAQAAMDAACEAAGPWAATEPRERAEILRRAYELVVKRQDTFATIMTLEMGKPLAESRGEALYGAEFLRWFSEEAVRIDGRWTVAPSGGTRLLVMRQPVGPVYAITPWNFPLAMGTRKIAPALAAGCTVIIKPASLAPLTTLFLMQVLQDAGVPAGVVNCLTTVRSAEVSEVVLGDPRLRKLTFTGSTEVGRLLLEQAAGSILRTSMELGGNAPFLVLQDADLDVAVPAAMAAKFRNNGEACTAANRLYVHRGLVDEFQERFTRNVEELRLGPGLADDTTLGPLVDRAALDKVVELVDDAVSKGARVLAGGRAEVRPGHYMQPTVLGDVPHNARLLHEEIFGPVAPIVAVESDEEAVRRANDTEFGLIAYVMTCDVTQAVRVAESLEVGMVALNTGIISNPAAPFGGVKQSGLGREGSHEGIEEYLETKYVGLSL